MGDFLWDDRDLLVENEFVRNPDHLARVFTTGFWDTSSRVATGNPNYGVVYRPVVKLAYWVQYRLFGDQTFGFHVANLLLHLCCVALAALWLRRRVPSPNGGLLAFLSVALFALHPSRVESVSWIAGCTDLWMTLFVMIGLLCWTHLPTETSLMRSRWLWFSCVSFSLAVLSKEVAIFVPLALAADTALLGPGLKRQGVPLLIATACVGLAFALGPVVAGWPASAGGPFDPVRALSTLGHYVARVWVPVPSSVHPIIQAVGPAGSVAYMPWSIALGAGVVLSASLLGVGAWRKPALRPWLADGMWFLWPLLPVLNIVPMHTYSLVADRFLYLPMIGVAALLLRALSLLQTRAVFVRWAAAGAVLTVLAGFAPLTALHAWNFRSGRALWTHEHELQPRNVIARGQMVHFATAERRFDDALVLLREGHRRSIANRDFPSAVHFLLRAAGILLATTSDADQATLSQVRAFYDRLAREPVIELRTSRLTVGMRLPPALWQSTIEGIEDFRLPRATAYSRTGRLSEAREQFVDIVGDMPRAAIAWHGLGLVEARQGRWDEALSSMERAARHLPADPTIESARLRLADAHRIAMQPIPDDASKAIRDARVQSMLGSPEASRQILDAAMTRHPGRADLVMSRAQADVNDGRFDLARRVLERARDGDPAHVAEWNLALQRLDEAEVESGPIVGRD